MREEVIFRMESAYREDFEVKSYHFGGPEKTMCIIGNMRGNEIQQLYIAGQMVRTLKRFEEEGRFIRRHGVTVIPCANPYSVNVGKRFCEFSHARERCSHRCERLKNLVVH